LCPIPGGLLGNYEMTHSFRTHSVVLGPLSLLTDMSTKNVLGGKVRPASTADGSALLVASNIKIRMEAQHSIPLLILQDFLQETCTFKIAVVPSIHVQHSIPLLILQDLLQETCTFKIAVVPSIHAKDKSYKKVQKYCNPL